MRAIDPVEHIRENPEMYLPEGGAIPAYLATRLAGDALLLGAGRVEISRHGDWWHVVSDHDWIAASSVGDVKETFSHVLPFPEAGVNAMRSEVLLLAFADAVVTTAAGRCATLKGDPADRATICKIHPDMPDGRIVAFKVDQDQE